jgi:polygalacturonase
VEGITIINSPFWTVNPEFCENVTVTGVTINNPPSPNTDGINPESCKYVHISNCHISVGDDCITIKSGKDGPGRAKAVPAQNYTITNCTMLSGHGGVVIGSEMSGGVKNIVISNCVFDGTDRGIRIKTTRGRGGAVEDIRVDNIIMKNIREQAFVLDMAYSKTEPEPVSERTPQIKNISYSNVTAYTNEACFINGLDEMAVENIRFSDVVIYAQSGFVIQKAKDIFLDNVSIQVQRGAAVTAKQTTGLELSALRNPKPLNGMPVISLQNVQNAWIRNTRPATGTSTFLQLQGADSKEIILQGNQFTGISEIVKKASDVNEQAVQIINQ